MASAHIATDLRYLTDAAHLLRNSAPDTAAHLMRHRAGLMSHNNLCQHELQRQHVCSACGNIMVPGQDTGVRLESSCTRTRRPSGKKTDLRSASKSKGVAPHSSDEGPTKVLTCGRCHRVTRVNLPAPPSAVRPQATKKKVKMATESSAASSSKLSTNASSKKRAKNRKAGLQALLSGQQQQSASLSLADFMRK
ncbi:uncharacterized protein DCS_02382 [Drechmeria coniospora]|uniref:DUF866 domain protein n=1 Tax=Drechmeria coniospora TaxID=98403 RepID=A0A151GVZ2_DRECN|nr:uncharacterized protein DCS_02382 [Drechmeria coniospora]KYK61240.1 uncharacterized protein DCS_02382 [Drechmeria coniospora]ODA81004.1 hypothetical protein RJ55_03965 [Drechmeria coniospora]